MYSIYMYILLTLKYVRFFFFFFFFFFAESTHTRVLHFGVFSMACLLGLASWQVMYLRHYFKTKKLIE